ncbi:MAG: hypothetical protein GF414_00705 [Candidatus Altiarchaeales archaeon]|nr:hypothetical protein [Candidatus Altiarchaeales archaeon]
MARSLTTQDRRSLSNLVRTDPAMWMESSFYIEDPRDPFTGHMFPPGPIRLHPIQKRILRAALTKVGGRFPYATIVYSTIKKSGKTRLAAGVASWYAATQAAFNEIYCLANDGVQSTDRILKAVRKSVKLSKKAGKGSMAAWDAYKTEIRLPNDTFIRALPCNAEGEAGSNPGLTVWSEMWGYSEAHKERLWTEMTIPPTRWGRALRWVESYAGYTGESLVLENLYNVGTKEGERHPLFPDLPVYYNLAANMFCYWDDGDAARRMPWQTEDYYRQEASLLTPTEFDRIHRNLWADPVQKAIPIEWWDACMGRVPALDGATKVNMAIDASVSGDCTACVLTSRDPKDPSKIMVRAVRIWTPPKGGKIDLEETVLATLLEWHGAYNLKEVAYDPYQLHNMMTRVRKMKLVKLHEFGQAGERSKADKQLLDLISAKRMVHRGESELRQHVDNAQAKQGEKFRFVRPDISKKGTSPFTSIRKPIDALVALSMATDRCLHLRM